MVGRDIGTVVLPEAEIKIYLDASVEERARRRYAECLGRGVNVGYTEVLQYMRQRAEIDSTRHIAPLKPAQDALIMNSDGKTAQEIFAQTKTLLEEKEKLGA